MSDFQGNSDTVECEAEENKTQAELKLQEIMTLYLLGEIGLLSLPHKSCRQPLPNSWLAREFMFSGFRNTC